MNKAEGVIDDSDKNLGVINKHSKGLDTEISIF